MNSRHSNQLMRNLTRLPVSLIALAGCGNPLTLDPATPVILKITGIEEEAERDTIQQAEPEEKNVRLPTTATPSTEQYYAQLKKAAKQQTHRDSPAIDIPSLIKLLDSKDERQRADALKSLAKAGPNAAEALPKLLEILQQEDSYAKTLALRCIGEIGPAAADAVPYLHTLLKNRDKHFVFRMEAIGALGRIGPAGEVVIPTLIDLLKNPGELVKSYPKAGGAPSAMGLMIPMLQKGDDGRWYFDSRDKNIVLAIGGLASFGAAAAHAIPELEKVRDNPDMLSLMREGAKKAIEDIQAEVDKQQEESKRPPPASRPESTEPS